MASARESVVAFVVASFVAIDVARRALAIVADTDAVLALQRDVRAREDALRAAMKSLERSNECLNGKDARDERMTKMLLELEEKVRVLEGKRTNGRRAALRAQYWLAATKAALGAFACAFHGKDFVFAINERAVWPLGAWLSFPWRAGIAKGGVGVVPWVLLSAVASERFARGVLEPFARACARAIARGKTRGRAERLGKKVS